MTCFSKFISGVVLIVIIGLFGINGPASVNAGSVGFGVSIHAGHPGSLVRHRHHRFKPHKHHHVRVIPRIGFRLHALPFGHVRIVIGGSPFYVNGGVFYQPARSGFVVVKAPHGALVTSLPIGYTVLHRGSQTYYVCEGTYFRKAHGKRGYIVVKKPSW